MWLLWACFTTPIKNDTITCRKLWCLSAYRQYFTLGTLSVPSNVHQDENMKLCKTLISICRLKNTNINLFPWMSTHEKKINFTAQHFLEIFFWIITLKYIQAWAWLTMPIWNTWIIFFYFHGYLTSFFTYWKLIILKYFEHAQAHLNTPNLNI